MFRVSFRISLAAGAALLLVQTAGRAAGPLAIPAAVSLNAGMLQAAGLPADFAQTIDRKLAFRRDLAESETQKAWLAQLKSFYSSRTGVPVWVDSRGYNKFSQSAMAELANAGNWGLDALDFSVPSLDADLTSLENLADAEIGFSLTVVKYADQARGGRIDPSALSLWLDHPPVTTFATGVMIEVISNANAGEALRKMHPQAPAFELLRQAYLNMRQAINSPAPRDPASILSPGPKLKVGQWHPDIVIIRQRVGLKAAVGFESQFDEDLASALHDFMGKARIRMRWGVVDDRVRGAINRPLPPPKESDLQQILANMERWRWVPAELGKLHIWNNLPEYMTRVVKHGAVIHEERIIIGQPETQTPVFSAPMRQVVFQPEWGVPPSIKINDLLPKLQDGDFDVLDRRDMRILSLKGKELNPERFNWDKVDIRDVGIYQRAGDANPLGLVKFLFPNKHHVYMHDTNNRALFKHNERTYSHGCIRVRDPQKFAELILGEDQGWDKKKVEKNLLDWDKPSNKIDLVRPIPVHNVYFTLIPTGDGHLKKLDDIYGHDKRIVQALSGVPAQRIAANDPARNQQRELDEAAPPLVKKHLRASGQKKSEDDDDE